MWDKKYGGEEYFYGTVANGFLRKNYTSIPRGPVLCLAEGEGRNAVFLAEQGYEVTAVDQSIAGIEKGRRLAKTRGVDVDFIHADLQDFNIGTAQWSGIISIFCHLSPELRKSVHARVITGLKPDGVFLSEAYTPRQIPNTTGGPKMEGLLLTPEILRAELGTLNFTHLVELEREIIEGSGHSGIGVVVQSIAVKPA